MSREPLAMWTVYDHPADFPDSFVARRWDCDSSRVVATDEVVIGELVDVRATMSEMGLTPLARSEDDDPTIVEVWL